MAFFKSLHLHSPRLATNDRFSLMRCGARMRCGTRPRCRRKSVEDCQHGGTGTLSGVESLRRGNFRLVSQDEPAEVSGRIIQPRLHIRDHLWRTPCVHSNCAHRLACAYRGGEVSAFRRPKNRIEETVSPRGIVGGCRRSLAFSSRCLRRSFSPVSEQVVQLGGSGSTRRGHGHVQGQRHP